MAETEQQTWLREALRSNERILTLMQGLAANGCAFVKPGQISVSPCKDSPNLAGGFHPQVGIRLCEEFMNTKEILEDTLTHELVHAYDWCTMDWDLNNLHHQACSEVRAGLLSGDCRLTMELRRGKFPMKLGQRRIDDCVKRRAILSLLGNPNCRDREQAKAAVEKVFESCSKDKAPFSDAVPL
ncbi:Mitochondrial inner membrane protease atp23 [Podochytrium sp. JEL0797]|nr:Mitochondrial inner membrane protease atp23 [Podochytrium sp. JEL0797]